MTSATTPSDPHRLFRGWRAWGIGFGFWTAIGMLGFGYQYLDVFVRGRSEPFHEKFIEELTGAYGAGILFPLVIWYSRRVRERLSRWYAKLALHAPGVIVFSLLHTTWNAVTRAVAYAAFGLGGYDYGIMPIRYAMEFPNDVIGYLIFVGFVYLFDHYRRARDREVQVAQLEAEVAQVRLRSLETQLQPHFLFNALNTVSSVMYEDPATADAMLTRLGDLLRATLRSAGVHEIPLREELEMLDLYVEIMRARFADRLDIRLDVDPDTTDAAIPQLLLQPLVENAIRHGDPGVETPARIRVRTSRVNGRLHLEVTDNGPGITSPSAELIRQGVGLQNTARRLVHLYGADHRFELRNGDRGGLVVSIEIPHRRLVSLTDDG